MVKDTIFVVYEENHGAIGVVTTPEAAARLIIDEGWMTAQDDIWSFEKQEAVFAFEAMTKLGYMEDDLYSFCCGMFRGDHEEYDWCFSLSEKIFYH